MKKTSLALAALTSLGLALPAAADGLNYNFIDGRYVDVEPDNSNVEFDGFSIGGQALLNPNVYVLGGYSTLDADPGSAEIDTITAGLGYRHPLAAQTDLNAEAAFLHVDTGPNDDSGFQLGLGVRHRFTEVFEGKAGVAYADVGNTDDTGIVVGGLAHLTPQFAIGLDYSTTNDADGFSVGGRFNF